MVKSRLLEEFVEEELVEKPEDLGKREVGKGTEILEITTEELKKRGRPGLTEEEKEERAREKLEKVKTPYVGGTPLLEDSGGWCLTESKTVTTIVDRRTGKKTVEINGLEVTRR